MKYAITIAAFCSLCAGGQAQGRVDVQGTQPPEYLEYVRLAHTELIRARDLIKEGKYDGAVGVLKPAIERYGYGTMGPTLRRELGEVAIRQGRLKEALTLMPPRREGQWGTARDYATIGFLEAAVGDYAVSKAMWDEAGPVRHIIDNQVFRDDWPDVFTVDGLKAAWLIIIADLWSGFDSLGQDYYLGAAHGLVPDNPIVNYFMAGRAVDHAEAERLYTKAAHFSNNYQFQQSCLRSAKEANYRHKVQQELAKGGGGR